tara:strand:- start:54 stop:191 length:138 start_codon:yes stop_codon:yes gene_type:complete
LEQQLNIAEAKRKEAIIMANQITLEKTVVEDKLQNSQREHTELMI